MQLWIEHAGHAATSAASHGRPGAPHDAVSKHPKDQVTRAQGCNCHAVNPHPHPCFHVTCCLLHRLGHAFWSSTFGQFNLPLARSAHGQQLALCKSHSAFLASAFQPDSAAGHRDLQKSHLCSSFCSPHLPPVSPPTLDSVRLLGKQVILKHCLRDFLTTKHSGLWDIFQLQPYKVNFTQVCKLI